MTNQNRNLLVSIRKSLDEIPVKVYNEVNIKLAIYQAIDQILQTESVEEDKHDENPVG